MSCRSTRSVVLCLSLIWPSTSCSPPPRVCLERRFGRRLGLPLAPVAPVLRPSRASATAAPAIPRAVAARRPGSRHRGPPPARRLRARAAGASTPARASACVHGPSRPAGLDGRGQQWRQAGFRRWRWRCAGRAPRSGAVGTGLDEPRWLPLERVQPCRRSGRSRQKPAASAASVHDAAARNVDQCGGGLHPRQLRPHPMVWCALGRIRQRAASRGRTSAAALSLPAESCAWHCASVAASRRERLWYSHLHAKAQGSARLAIA